MKASLEAVGRFDENRVRTRFLDRFSPEDTLKILVGGSLVGFYVILDKGDHLYLDHLYILPAYQGKGLGGKVITKLKVMAQGSTIKLGALKGSASNEFYLNHGFRQTHSDEFDIYYQFN
ncbi:N-acetyltransferase [Motilimonas pumila]|uniref:N-acetyltransferase n=2 Tax=Motilimonas pumila TaxID=2303987 RepID=A0A418Y913_9GAMM|nr:N-acetyltransferase [Motilimonas pumila]